MLARSTASVLVPIEPVAPRMVIRRFCAPSQPSARCEPGRPQPDFTTPAALRRMPSHGRCRRAPRPRAANTRPSTRSIMPPWPGMMSPESFTPKRRLTARLEQIARLRGERKRARATKAGPIVDPSHAAATRPAAMPAASPPIAPDQVFFGRDRAATALGRRRSGRRSRRRCRSPRRRRHDQRAPPGRNPAQSRRTSRPRPSTSRVDDAERPPAARGPVSRARQRARPPAMPAATDRLVEAERDSSVTTMAPARPGARRHCRPLGQRRSIRACDHAATMAATTIAATRPPDQAAISGSRR